MNECIFCTIENGKTETQFLYQDEHLIVFNDIHPKAKTHILVVPRLHIPSLLELQTEHKDMLAHLMLSLGKIAAKLKIPSFRTIINTGAASGQEIPHLHLHMLSGSSIPGFY